MNIVPELIQNDASPEKISHEIIKILDNQDYANNMRRDLSRIKGLLKGDNETRLEKLVISMLEEN